MEIRRLGPRDAADFRETRLECLRLHPENFGTVGEVEKERPLADFARMLDKHRFWGGWRDGALDGIVGFYVMPRAKERHRGVLYAMYVRDAARGTGMTPAQRLRRVELPLAAPVILSGVRLSAIIALSTATIGSTVAARTLGEVIIAGLLSANSAFVVQGGAVVAALAILISGAFREVERALTRGARPDAA